MHYFRFLPFFSALDKDARAEGRGPRLRQFFQFAELAASPLAA
jgi:hypothetical protein